MLLYPQNPDFVGRQDIFEQLQKELVITSKHQLRAVLWGLGGAGSVFYIPLAISATNRL
jgi:hypothetical protein